MVWWRRLWGRHRAGAAPVAAPDAAHAAAMARLRGQCGLGAGECTPWDAPEPGAREGEENGEAADERR